MKRSALQMSGSGWLPMPSGEAATYGSQPADLGRYAQQIAAANIAEPAKPRGTLAAGPISGAALSRSLQPTPSRRSREAQLAGVGPRETLNDD